MTDAQKHETALHLLEQIAHLANKLVELAPDTTYMFEQQARTISGAAYGAAEAIDEWLMTTEADLDEQPSAVTALENLDDYVRTLPISQR